MSQAQRNLIIKRFKQQELSIVVATDVAARGIDVADLTHVINYSIPDDLESYVHRIGRTGRAGKEGTAITFISKSEQRLIHQIERKFSVAIQPIDIPSVDTLIQSRIEEARDYAHQVKPLDKPAMIALHNIVSTVDPVQLSNITSQLLYDKFLSKLDLEDIPYTHVESSDNNNELQEISISAGLEENIAKHEVIEYLTQTGVVTEDQIKSVRILKVRTFVKLAGTCTPELVTALRGKPLAGRAVRVNVTCLVGNPEPGRGAGRYGGDRRGGQARRGGDRRSGGSSSRGGYSRSRSY
jgi:ATP-dependent RNA helicase DeaD